jgi:hypothetical protein
MRAAESRQSGDKYATLAKSIDSLSARFRAASLKSEALGVAFEELCQHSSGHIRFWLLPTRFLTLCRFFEKISGGWPFGISGLVLVSEQIPSTSALRGFASSSWALARSFPVSR